MRCSLLAQIFAHTLLGARLATENTKELEARLAGLKEKIEEPVVEVERPQKRIIVQLIHYDPFALHAFPPSSPPVCYGTPWLPEPPRFYRPGRRYVRGKNL